MKQADLYYKDIHLGTLYKTGRFDYKIDSSYADKMNISAVVDYLELIRLVGREPDFDLDRYIQSWQKFCFNDLDDYRFVERY